MRRTVKGLAAAAALVVPIAVGWVYTAEASVGENGSGFAGLFSDETVDEFLIDDYLITRESQDGAVTMSVVGPDGAAVALAELPSEIAERVSYFESEWAPEESGPTFEIVDGVACYIAPSGLGANDDLDVFEHDNSVIRALEAKADDSGTPTVQARQWDFDDLTPQQRDQLSAGDAELADLPGGAEIAACAD
ncbi:MAG: hypothetical protein ACRBK7_30700 [Acidimicrobiales bacterium]